MKVSLPSREALERLRWFNINGVPTTRYELVPPCIPRGLGRAAYQTMINKLVEEGFIKQTRAGLKITAKGIRIVESEDLNRRLQNDLAMVRSTLARMPAKIRR
jgi:hypothetical protein